MRESNFASNPFAVLDAWGTDPRSRLDEGLVRARLLGDAKAASLAHQQLVNLGQRLSAEVSWFPGLADDQRGAIAKARAEGQVSRAMLDRLPDISRANLMLALTEREIDIDGEPDPSFTGALVADVIGAWSRVTRDGVFADINRDRSASGFAPLNNAEQLRPVLETLARTYREILREALRCLDVHDQAKILTDALAPISSGAKTPPSPLLTNLVDDYETDARGAITRARELIDENLESVSDLIEFQGSSSAIALQVQKLIDAVFEWDAIVQPVQVARQRQVKVHTATIELHRELRELALRLVNERGLPKPAKMLTECFADAFREVRKVMELTEKDLEALNTILDKKKPRERKGAAWRKAVTWESRSRSGHLRISPDGIEYGYESIGLSDITRFRLLRDRTPGIQVSGPSEHLNIHFSNSKTINAFIDRLMTAIADDVHYGWHLAIEEGGSVKVGPVGLTDDGLVINRKRIFRDSEAIKVPWDQVRLIGGDGGMIFQDSRDSRLSEFLSYYSVDNTITLEVLVKRLKATKNQLISDFY